jgi:RNA polymerase sigma-70 factor (family 1)
MSHVFSNRIFRVFITVGFRVAPKLIVMNISEQQLMDNFRQGDEMSLTLLFHEFYPALCLFALRITDDQSAAEDIAEGAFLKIWERRDSFFHIKVLRSYLYTSVKNASINYRLQRQRRIVHEGQNGIGIDISESTVEENIIRAETFREIYTALEKLPPQCRKIISMIFRDGKNSREVAEELNLAVGTVKTQKARGLTLLKRYLLTNKIIFLFCTIAQLF